MPSTSPLPGIQTTICSRNQKGREKSSPGTHHSKAKAKKTSNKQNISKTKSFLKPKTLGKFFENQSKIIPTRQNQILLSSPHELQLFLQGTVEDPMLAGRLRGLRSVRARARRLFCFVFCSVFVQLLIGFCLSFSGFWRCFWREKGGRGRKSARGESKRCRCLLC